MPPKGSRKKADNSKDNLVVAQSDPNKIKEILEKAKQRAKAAVGTKSDTPAGDTKKLIALPQPNAQFRPQMSLSLQGRLPPNQTQVVSRVDQRLQIGRAHV